VRRLAIVAALASVPGAASAHDAFGDLGPFYATLLHPLAHPGQGLILAATGVLLARQPLATVRLAWAALALAGAVSILAGAAGARAAPGLVVASLAATALGLVALSGIDLGRWPAVVLAAAAAVAAGLAIQLPPGFRSAMLAAVGGTLGIALFGLMVWGLVDLLQRRVGRVAGAVAGSWIAAVGLMAAAFELWDRLDLARADLPARQNAATRPTNQTAAIPPIR
jgi:urease accessory protein